MGVSHLTLPEGIRRVQVKSSTRRTPNGGWLVRVGRRPYSLDKSAGRAPYDPDSLDYFFVVDGSGTLYLLPSHVPGGRVEIVITAYGDYRVGSSSSLLVGLVVAEGS
jgi:hypothetical protein